MQIDINCFKAYDARGQVPDELNDEIAYRVGRAYAEFVKPRQVAVGRDIRLSSDSLFDALSNGLIDSGVDVLDLGICGTENVYFAAFHQHLDGGIMITASHNPVDYNGFKFVRHDARPISGDSGLDDIRKLAEIGEFPAISTRGELIATDLNNDYIDHLLGYLSAPEKLKPLKIVSNPGNGTAGPAIDLLEKKLPFEFIKIQHTPDGNFPNGIPNPLLPEGRRATTEAIQVHNADLGLAWDGDFDRCFLFDHNGRFIEGYYIVGLLGEALLRKNPGEKVIHDPRLVWNTRELVNQCGGEAVQSKAGHAFIKETMRKVNAVYGGEMSAHHFFRDFGYCDSGMVPWLLLTELMSDQNKTLSQLVDERIQAYPVSGEINISVDDSKATLQKLEQHYAELNPSIDKMDGLGMDFGKWRFNVRASNTEPLLRINVESRANQELMQTKTDELLGLIEA
ncbi:MAG: phosphomannomutase [Gammaproteobacteria bacterium]|nr:phosphomannomutase [Gammaproteobacteria bacterium]